MSHSDESTEKLDSSQHIKQQRREWLVERIGWGLIACIILAALLGGLGFGPLSSRDAASGDGSLRASFYAIERAQAGTKLELWREPDDGAAKEFDLAISRTFLDEVTLESLVPEPTKVAADGDHIVFTFSENDLTRGGKIVCRYKHNHCGVVKYEIAIVAHEPLRISQFVLP
jgi:hypothetical protein